MSALPPKADIGTWPSQVQRNSSGSLAMFAAIRRAPHLCRATSPLFAAQAHSHNKRRPAVARQRPAQ